MSIKENLLEINENIEKALIKSGRKEKVELIAVTKMVDIPTIEEAINCGITNIGENKVQELERKYEFIKDKANFHLIGSLQTNKVRFIIDKVKLIHSLDRKSLLEELNKRAKALNIQSNVLIQVNVAKEDTKSGLMVEDVIPFIEDALNYENIKIRGLMTIGPLTDDEKILRSVFRTMYSLKENIEGRSYKDISLDYLSMGMTNDYEIAIEEGSNMIRVGTGIFGKRNY